MLIAHSAGQPASTLRKPLSTFRFGANPREAEEKPSRSDSKASSKEADWDHVSIANQSDGEDPAELVENPDRKDYVAWRQKQEKEAYEAIGRRFAAPGHALNAAENQAKALSRKFLGQTRDLASSTGKAICRNAATLLKKAAKAIEGWQE